MLIDTLAPGDIIYAANNITNDGSLPGLPEEAVIAEKDQRGVIINTGHLEDQPDKVLVLVRFETGVKPGELGPAVACWPDELYIPDHVIN
ncbi:nitrogen fixation protein NifZ [Alteromonadaceae bacterium 2753L.S.0a.02]|nr:nitrogen fixation protein NifZ [Alteromonadaceae bacterium 2753L.S.0a.02]